MSTQAAAPPPTLAVSAPVRQSRLADQLYEQVLEQIISGHLPEHSRLPTEAALSRLFGVSRPVVREALSRLKADGLIVSRQGSGSYVERRPPREFLRLAPIGDVADLLRCFEVRIALETEAAGLAAERRTGRQLEAIRAALGDLERAIATGAVGTEADLGFHQAVAAATGNDVFANLMASLHRQIENGIKLARNLSLLRDAERLARVQREHETIFAAIAAGDVGAAGTAMRRHLDNARTRILSEQAEP